MGFGFLVLDFGVRGLRVGGLGFGVRGLRFGFWGVGFGVCGFGVWGRRVNKRDSGTAGWRLHGERGCEKCKTKSSRQHLTKEIRVSSTLPCQFR